MVHREAACPPATAVELSCDWPNNHEMSLIIEALAEQDAHHVPLDSTSLGETSHGAKQHAQWSPYEGTQLAVY